MMESNKRRRDDDDSDDDPDPTYGMRQILPVAALPAHFSGEPVDGLQYLFTVRRDAKLLPAITRVPNPYESAPCITPPKVESNIDDTQETGQGQLSEKWRSIFIQRFKGFRENLNQPTQRASSPTQAKLKSIPDKRDRDAWWDFVSGAPQTVWHKPPSKRSTKPKRKGGGGLHGELDPSDPDVVAAGWQMAQPLFPPTPNVDHLSTTTPASSLAHIEPSSLTPTSPREPTPTLILQMDHRMAIHLIMYFTYWINQHLEASDRSNNAATKPYTPLESHARWLFALLARVDSYCSADDMNGLRSLVRACLAFVRSRNAHYKRFNTNDDDGDADSDIASTPGVQTVDLPPAEDSADPTFQSLSTQETRASAGDTSLQSPPVMSANSVRLILCAVAGYWHQRDLWSDAEGAFN